MALLVILVKSGLSYVHDDTHDDINRTPEVVVSQMCDRNKRGD